MRHLFNIVYATIIVAWLRRVWERICPPGVPVAFRHGWVDWYWVYVNGCFVAQTGDKGRAYCFARCLAEIVGPDERYEIRAQDEPEPYEEMAIFEPDVSDRVARLIDSMDMETPDAYG